MRGFRLPGTRRGSRAWLFVLGLIAGVSIVAGAPYLIAADDARRPPIEEMPVTLELPPGFSLDSLQRAKVDEVVDGDTIDVLINNKPVRIRYFGIDTPERGDVCFREALDRNGLLAGDTVLLLPDEREFDNFGRILRYVFTEDGVSIDATMVKEGYAEAWEADGYYRDRLLALEAEARAANRGCLWSDD